MNNLTHKFVETRRRIGRIKRRALKRKVWPLISPYYIDYNSDYRNSIFLAGTFRGGTTWVSDIINYKREYRYIFEPFWADKVDICRQFKPQQYLRPDNQDPYFLETTKTILSGKLRNKWTDKYHRTFIANKRLIKDIRANLFLKWMHVNFPEMPIVFLLRHPCAVAGSQLRKQNWIPSLEEEYFAQETLVADFLNPFREEIKKAQTHFEKIVFRWCIQNYVPLKQFERGEIHLAFYEHFCETPKSEIDKLFSFLGKNYDETIFGMLRKPSPESHEVSAIISGGSLVNSWKKRISADQAGRAIEILSLFGLDRIYTQETMPNVEGAYEVMAEKLG